MQSKPLPKLMPVPFATNGARNDIPEASQISITQGAASLNDGFPPLTMTNPLQGGIPPFGKDMNGVLFLFAQTLRWVQAGGSFVYDPVFANDPAVGGYPIGAVLLNTALTGFWINTVEDNVTDPDATDGSASGWLSMNADWNATSGPGQILNKPRIPDAYSLPPATTSALGGVIVGTGLSVTDDGTLTAQGAVKTVNTHTPDPLGNVPVFVKNAKGTSSKYVGLVVFQGGTGDPLISMLQAQGVGTSVYGNGEAVQVDLVPATTNTLGGVIPGAGLSVKDDGTLAAAGTAIVNIPAAASVALDLSPIAQGAPEILFNLPVADKATTTITVTNPPAPGNLAEFVLQVKNGAGSTIVWPSGFHWPQGIVPSLSGVAGVLDTFVIFTQDGGSTYDAFVAGQNQ